MVRRRHFITRFRELLGIEDELFTGELDGDPNALKGERTLVAALESARSGRLGDIVGTIQAEQDEIIRAPLAGAHVVQGGPGTGKTVVALHRAAYLLYTHRFPLARQGVLVIGPNRLFLTYIEQVLPSLGESGVELAVLGDFVPMGISNVASQPVGSNSLDNTLRIIDVRPSEWYLLDIEAGGIANGFGHGQLRIWDDQGNLQAIASQSVVVRDRRKR